MTVQHPLPQDDTLLRGKGWAGLPAVELDGDNWTLAFAAKHLEIPEGLLREVVKYLELEPSGTMNMREYRSQGRTPRAYPAKTLIDIAEALMSLRECRS